jgi:formylglycine-generating enzyme required for sulfatase activity
VVAGTLNPRHDCAVRPLLAVVALAGVAGASGRVVRIEQPPRREVFVPAGTFWMGVPEDDIDMLYQRCTEYFEPHEIAQFVSPATGQPTSFCEMYRDELLAMPVHQVYLSAFAIDRDEVTVADYRACVFSGACALDPLISGDERYIHDEWPLVNVTWQEADEFCHWRGGRLPTEAEWERAARGNADGPWPWCSEGEKACVERQGDFNHGQARSQAMRDVDRTGGGLIPIHLMGDPDDVDGAVLLAKPGSYPWSQGPYGTRDQAGNVAEWTADARGKDDATFGYRGLGGEGRPLINPRRDGTGTDARVVRGGSWRQPSFIARDNVRDPFGMVYLPDRRFSHVGFRCARTTR